MVFARVCSGRFERDLKVFHSRTGKEIRLSNTHTMFGRDRETMEEAYPGDIIGFVTTTPFRVGDTLTTNPKIVFEKIPRFSPECFAFINNLTTAVYKAFRKGLDHLIAEDIVQTFTLDNKSNATPMLGAVGMLQFEVLQYRLKDEYGVDTNLEMQPWTTMRWLETPVDESLLSSNLSYGVAAGKDSEGKQVLFFKDEWALRNFAEKRSEIKLADCSI